MRADVPLRILSVVPDLRIGGAERHLATILPALDADRFTASVLCLGERGPLADELEASGVPVGQLGVPAAALSVPAAVRALVARLRRARPHVVMTQGLRADVLGRLAARAAGVPVVAAWKHNTGTLGWRGPAERRLERWVLGRVTDRYFAVAHAQVHHLVEHVGLPAAKIRVIRNTIAIGALPSQDARVRARARLDLPGDAAVVGCVAVLRPEKDHATLLEAFAQAPVGDHLVLVGDGPERGTLEELARQLGIAARVVFAGMRHDVRDLLPAFDVLALASRTIETAPYVVLEAMDAGLPVVATAVGALPELVDEGVTGYLVPPGSPQALAGALTAVLCAPDKGAALGRAGRERLARSFAFERSVEMLQDELTSLVRHAPLRSRRTTGT